MPIPVLPKVPRTFDAPKAGSGAGGSVAHQGHNPAPGSPISPTELEQIRAELRRAGLRDDLDQPDQPTTAPQPGSALSPEELAEVERQSQANEKADKAARAHLDGGGPPSTAQVQKAGGGQDFSQHLGMLPGQQPQATPAYNRAAPPAGLEGLRRITPEQIFRSSDPSVNPLADIAPPNIQLQPLAPLASRAIFPEEHRLAMVDARLNRTAQAGAYQQTGSERAPGNPRQELRAQQFAAIIQAGTRLPVMAVQLEHDRQQLQREQENVSFLIAQDDALKKQGVTQGRQSPADRALLDKRAKELIGKAQHYEERRKAARKLFDRVRETTRTYNEVPLHGGTLYPEEQRAGRAPFDPEDPVSNFSAYSPQWLRTAEEAILPLMSQATAEQFPAAIAHRILIGDIPPPVPIPPGMSKAQREQLIHQKNELLTWFQAHREAPHGEGVHLDYTGDELNRRRAYLLSHPPPQLTPWQQRIYPTVVQQYVGTLAAGADAQLGKLTAIDFGMLGANLWLFHGASSLIEGQLTRTLGRALIVKGLPRILREEGTRAAVKALGVELGVRTGSAAGAGALTSSLTAPLSVLASGGSGSEAISSIPPAALGGGTIGLLFGALGFAGRAIPEVNALVRSQGLEVTENAIAKFSQAARANKVSEPIISEIQGLMRQMGHAPPGEQYRYWARIEDIARSETALTGKVRPAPIRAALPAHIAPPGAAAPGGLTIEPRPAAGAPAAGAPAGATPTTGPGVAAAGGIIRIPAAGITAENPEVLQRLRAEAVAQGDLGRIAAIDHWTNQHANWLNQNSPPLPAELVPEFNKDWNNPRNPARRQHDVLSNGASNLAETNKPLADLIAAAARATRQAAIQKAIYDATPSNDLLAQQQANPPVAPVRPSIYRQLTDDQIRRLPGAVERALLVQDLSHSEQILAPGTPTAFTSPNPKGSLDELRKLADERFQQAAAKQQEEQDAVVANAQVAQSAAPTPPSAEATPAGAPRSEGGAPPVTAPTPQPAPQEAQAPVETATAPLAQPGQVTPAETASTLAPSVVPVPAGGGAAGGGEAVPVAAPAAKLKARQVRVGATIRFRGHTYEVTSDPADGKVTLRDTDTNKTATQSVQSLIDNGVLEPAPAKATAETAPTKPTPTTKAKPTTPAAKPEPAAAATPAVEGSLTHKGTGAQLLPTGNTQVVGGRAFAEVKVLNPGTHAALEGKQGQTIPFPTDILQRDFGLKPGTLPEKPPPAPGQIYRVGPNGMEVRLDRQVGGHWEGTVVKAGPDVREATGLTIRVREVNLGRYVGAEAPAPEVLGVSAPAETEPAKATAPAATATATKAEPARATAKKVFTLPEDLAGAKPGYNYGSKRFTLTFNNDLDRTAYIVAGEKGSKADPRYLKALQDHYPGASDEAIRALGGEVRDRIKGLARDADPGVLKVPSVLSGRAPEAPAAAPAEAPAAAPVAKTPPQAKIDAYEAKLVAKYGDAAIHEAFSHNSPLTAGERRTLAALYEARKTASEAQISASLETRKAARAAQAKPEVAKPPAAEPVTTANWRADALRFGRELADRMGLTDEIHRRLQAGERDSAINAAIRDRVPEEVARSVPGASLSAFSSNPQAALIGLKEGVATEMISGVRANPPEAPTIPEAPAAPGKPAPYYVVGNVNGQFDQTRVLRGFKTHEAAIKWGKSQAKNDRFVRYQVVSAAELGKQTTFPLAQAPPAGKAAINPSELRGGDRGTPTNVKPGGTTAPEPGTPAAAAPGAAGAGNGPAGGVSAGPEPTGGGVRAAGGAAAGGEAPAAGGAGGAGGAAGAGGETPRAKKLRAHKGAIITSFKRQRKPTSELKISGNTGDPQVDAAITRAMGPLEVKPLFQQIADGAKELVDQARTLVHTFDRWSASVNPDVQENAEFIKYGQQLQRAYQDAANEVNAMSRRTLDRLKPAEQSLVLNALIVKEAPYDLGRARDSWLARATAEANTRGSVDRAAGRATKPPQLPPEPVHEVSFGITSANHPKLLAEINRKLAANPRAAAALEEIERFRDRVSNEYYVAHLAAYGWAPELPNENYIHHEIIRYAQDHNLMGGSGGTSFETPGWEGSLQSRKPDVTEPWKTSWGDMLGRVLVRTITNTRNLQFTAFLNKNNHGPSLQAMALAINDPEVLSSLREISRDGVDAITKGSPGKPGSQSSVNLVQLGKAAKDGKLPDTAMDDWAGVHNTLASYYELAAGLPLGQYPAFPGPADLQRIKDYSDWLTRHVSTRPGAGVTAANLAAMTGRYAPIVIENSEYMKAMFRQKSDPAAMALAYQFDPNNPASPERMAELKESLEGGKQAVRVAPRAQRQRPSPVLWLPKEWVPALKSLRDPGIDADLKLLQKLHQGIMRTSKMLKYITPTQIGSLLRLKTITDLTGAVYFTNPHSFTKLPEAFKIIREWKKTGKASTDAEYFLYEGGAGRMFYSMAEDIANPKVQLALNAAVGDYLREMQPTPKVRDLVNRGGVWRPEMPIETWLRKTGRAVVHVGGKAVDILRIMPEYLDATIRMANYLSFLEKIRESPAGIPHTFGASNHERIMGLVDPRAKASQLAHDAVGNFDDNSKPIRWLNRNVWVGGGLMTQAALERRSAMLIRNTVTANRQAMLIGQRMADENPEIPKFWKRSPMLMWMVGRYPWKIASLLGGLYAANRWLNRDSENGLGPMQRGEPHLAIPAGKGHVLDLPITMMPGWAEWLHADHYGYYWEAWQKGRFTSTEIAKDMVGQFSDQAFVRMGPARMLQELHTGVSPFTNRPISPLEVPARYFGMQWALDLYEKQFHHHPMMPDWKADLAAHAFGFERFENSKQNYNEMRRAAKLWSLQQKGGDIPASQYSAPDSAAFWYRESLRRNDPIAAKYFLVEMARTRGLDADEDMDKAARRLEPMFMFAPGDQKEFLKGLDQDDAARMRVAYYYWKEWVAPKAHVEGLDKIADLNRFVSKMRDRVDLSLQLHSPAQQWLLATHGELTAFMKRDMRSTMHQAGFGPRPAPIPEGGPPPAAAPPLAGRSLPFDNNFNTILTPAQEQQFDRWKARYAPRDSGEDYDLRGAFKAGLQPDPKTGHWPDLFKKPNHPSFSDESKYAAYGRPGHWQGNQFIPPAH